MKTTATAIGSLAAAIALLALPLPAMAEYLVPPGNSAVNQYTESYPTAGGQKQAGEGRKAGRGPAGALGASNARKLRQRGADGRATAELAAKTAPGAASQPQGPGQDGRDRQGQAGAAPGSGSPGEDGSGSADRTAAGGSSGLGSVISQATGSSSSGGLGLLLPLAILAAIAWSVAYLLRQRKRPTA